MLYMVIEHFKPGAAAAVYARARERGRQLPAGLEYLDSWVDMSYSRCFQLMRTGDPALLDVWMRAWNDLVDFEIIPVCRSAEAAQAISRDSPAPAGPRAALADGRRDVRES
jgi:hypothetical protein